MSEKLCLNWDDFGGNFKTAFEELRRDKDFCDVTLACEDGQQFEAHRVILATSSPFFHNLFKNKMHQHTHPMIYLRGIKSASLSAIIDFLYCGEANVFQEDLDSFLALAEELKLKGLMGQTDTTKDDQFQESYASSHSMHPKAKELRKPDIFKKGSPDHQLLNVFDNPEHKVAIAREVSTDIQKLDEQVKSMMELSQNMVLHGKTQRRATACKVCGKEGNWTAIRDHIEAHHIEGVRLPCNSCEKTFRSRTSLRQHKC